MTELLGYEASERLPGLGHLIPMPDKESKGTTTPKLDSSSLLFVTITTLVITSTSSSVDLRSKRPLLFLRQT